MKGLAFIAAAALATAAAGWALDAAGPLKGPPHTIAQFGYIRSLTPKGNDYELRLDPAVWLEGRTARRAAKEDRQEAYDYYIRNPEHSLLTYRVPRNAPVTVVTVGNLPRSTRIGVSELAQIVRGGNPRHRPLIERGTRRYSATGS